MDAADLLQRLLDSNYRVAALKTQETDRLLALFKRYSLATGQAVYDWTARSGLYRVGIEHILIPRTRHPMDVLAYIAANRHYGIYLLQEFGPALSAPSIQKALCGLCDSENGIRRLVLLIGTDSCMSATLQGRIATIRHNVRERHSAAADAARANIGPVLDSRPVGARPRPPLRHADGQRYALSNRRRSRPLGHARNRT